MILTPPFSWFKEGNGYTGSCGTDPRKGSLCVKTFHFRLEVKQDETGEKYIEATDYVENPWPEGRVSDSDGYYRAAFSPEGLEDAKSWLSAEENRHLQKS